MIFLHARFIGILNLAGKKHVFGISSLSAFVSELFSEELGLVLEVSTDNKDKVMKMYKEAGVHCIQIGSCSESEEKSPQVYNFLYSVSLFYT